MKRLSTITIAAALVLTACGAREDSQVATTTEMGTTESGPAMRSWESAIVANPEFELAGEASIRDLDDGQTRVALEIRNAEEGATLPWHIHTGDCVTGGGIVGDASAYVPLTVNSYGEASSNATIDVTLDQDPDADYHINVHKSASEMDTIVACGELQEN